LQKLLLNLDSDTQREERGAIEVSKGSYLSLVWLAEGGGVRPPLFTLSTPPLKLCRTLYPPPPPSYFVKFRQWYKERREGRLI
jgi:hypothetical protein